MSDAFDEEAAERAIQVFGDEELARVFHEVANPHDWKAPILYLLRVPEGEDAGAAREKIKRAVLHYTASTATFKRIISVTAAKNRENWFHVEASGYRGNESMI